jgi:hypothetical protein
LIFYFILESKLPFASWLNKLTGKDTTDSAAPATGLKPAGSDEEPSFENFFGDGDDDHPDFPNADYFTQGFV